MNTFTVTQKRILTTLATIALLIAVLFGLTRLLEDKISYREKGDYFAADGDYDVFFFGVSHVQNGVLPMEMWREYGISSYNWGYSNSTPAQNYYLLREVLKESEPKVVVLDVNGIVEYEDKGNGKYDRESLMSSHVVFDRFPVSADKFVAVNDLFDDYDGRADFLWDFIIYHNRWDKLTREDLGAYTVNPERGAKSLAGISHTGIQLIPQEEKITNLEDYTCYGYFIKTLDMCREKGIPVLCVCLPHIMDETSQRVANTMGDVVAQYDNAAYYNMLYDNLLAYSIDTYIDGGHVNYAGACKTTSRLGEYLRNNYDLPDHSDDPVWKADYEKYLDFRRKTLAEQDQLSVFLMLLKDPGVDVDIEFCDENIWYSETIASEVYFGGLEPQPGTAPSDDSVAHTVIHAADGSVYDEAWWVIDESIESDDIGDKIVRLR